MDKENIVKIEKEIASNHNNIAGLSILKDNKLVYENYFNNHDEKSRIHVFAITQSITSLLIGIAIDKGYIKSVDQKVVDFFSDYNGFSTDKRIQQITIKNLLTMTTPYKYGLFPPSIKYFESQDWLSFSLNELGGKSKVGKFRYVPLIGPDILSGIIVQATGQSLLDFAKENLFEPLDIFVEKNINFFNKEDLLEFSESRTISGWVCDTKKLNSVGWGLTLSLADMSKIGQLFINSGEWNNKRVVSASWLTESTHAYSRWWRSKINLGYLWWVVDDSKEIYAALGDGGNVIYFNKSKNLVVSIAAIYEGKVKDRLKFIKEHIEPFV